MTTFPSLPIGPLEHVSMDYARLREEGLRLLGKLAGEQWTDFNTHDPGITILEQLCYAITDLGYRTAYPVPELLRGLKQELPPAEHILTTDPVTRADLRKLVLDADGIGNAWIETIDELAMPVYYHAPSEELRLRADASDPNAAPVRLRGLDRVVLQASRDKTSEDGRRAAAESLHAARSLASDFQIDLLNVFPIELWAAIEVDETVDDPPGLMAEIADRINGYLAPPAHFISRPEARAQGRSQDEIFDGPLLDHGFVDLLPSPRRTVFASDLLHAILDIPAVKAVQSLKLVAGGLEEQWTIEVSQGSVATLATTDTITLLRRGLPLRVERAEVERRQAARREEQTRALVAEPPAPPAALRDLTTHRSIQHQLPAAYGVGSLGLPASAPPERHAQARQLAAYLLIFDQLFANALAQLAHAAELLSPEEGPIGTYFAGRVQDPEGRLDLDALRAFPPGPHTEWLEQEVAKLEAGNPLERRKRFLAHLLARFAEELGDHSLIAASIRPAPEGADPRDEAREANEALIADRRAFLEAYPWLSSARGSGYDVSRHGSPAARAGFEERLRHKLGLRDHLRLHVVEHILLRPILEDRAQLADEGEEEVPLLAGVNGADPWSLQISVVIEEPPLESAEFERFVAQTIAAETPAHLTAHLHWLGRTGDVDHLSAFEEAWEDFRRAYAAYRADTLEGRPVTVERHLTLRDARDRVIDLLAIGRTYPLRDVPVPAQIIITPGARATIPLSFSQQGVTYELWNATGSARVLDGDAPISVLGTGGPIELSTPPIQEDATFRIRAVKPAEADGLPRPAWLRTVVRVIEGVDPALIAEIALPLLDARVDNPQPSDARIGDWGVQAEVRVFASQEGVTYDLIDNASDQTDPAKPPAISLAPVIGTSGTITLRARAQSEDLDIRVRGQKATGDASNRVIRTGILDLVLPLRVRANPATPAQLVPAVVPHDGPSMVRIGTTQASAEYQAHLRRVRDRDFVFDEPPAVRTIDVAGDGRTVRLERPIEPPVWQDLPGFTPAGTATRGNGADLNLPIGGPGATDTFVLVQASKRHQNGPLDTGAEEIPSAVQLSNAMALLVRPNPAPPLHLEVTIVDDATTGTLLVKGGQLGVAYDFRLEGSADPVGRPAYFHQRDDENQRFNKGIDQLRVEVDFVVVREGAANPVTMSPPPPLVDTAPLPAESVLQVTGRKAMSGLEQPLTHTALLAAIPPIAVDPPQVAPGGQANVVIQASRADERYWLERDGALVGEVTPGTDGRLALPAGALQESATFVVAMMRVGSPGIEVERRTAVTIPVVAPPAPDEPSPPVDL